MTIDRNVMNLRVGGKKQIGKVEAVQTQNVPDREGNILPKMILIVSTETNVFKVDEAWIYNKDNILKPQGLWIKLDSKGRINAISTLAKIMQHLNILKISDIVGKEVELYPKPNGFLALVACNDSQFEE